VSAFRKSLTKAVLSEYGRFPNPEASLKMQLGQIGSYDGWGCEFNWHRRLVDLNISVSKPKQEDIAGFVDEIFTIGRGTSIVFSGDVHGHACAHMTFEHARTLMAQATSMVCLSLDQQVLRRAIIDAIQRGTQWGRDWVVLTHVFVADSYTQFFANSASAEVKLASDVRAALGGFNLADTRIKLRVAAQRGTMHQLIAKKDVTPFFLIQKVKGWRREFPSSTGWSEEQLTLEPYGKWR
jgi:hypothetical protein